MEKEKEEEKKPKASKKRNEPPKPHKPEHTEKPPEVTNTKQNEISTLFPTNPPPQEGNQQILQQTQNENVNSHKAPHDISVAANNPIADQGVPPPPERLLENSNEANAQPQNSIHNIPQNPQPQGYNREKKRKRVKLSHNINPSLSEVDIVKKKKENEDYDDFAKLIGGEESKNNHQESDAERSLRKVREVYQRQLQHANLTLNEKGEEVPISEIQNFSSEESKKMLP